MNKGVILGGSSSDLNWVDLTRWNSPVLREFQRLELARFKSLELPPWEQFKSPELPQDGGVWVFVRSSDNTRFTRLSLATKYVLIFILVQSIDKVVDML